MADLFIWTQTEFGLDVTDMDNEHKVLIDKMNALHRAWEAKSSKDLLVKLAEDLGNYTVKHFKDEEEYMAKIKYSALEVHKVIHKDLLKNFTEHVTKFKATGKLENDFFLFLKTWLASHIRGIDMKYAKGKSGFAA